MTDPLPGKEPVPLTPPSQPITGDSHRHLIAPLIAHAATLGYRVEIRDHPEHGPGGWCDPKRKQIVVADGPANGQIRTLAHELAHAHGLGYEKWGRARAEVLVDCVIFWPGWPGVGCGAELSVGDGCERRLCWAVHGRLTACGRSAERGRGWLMLARGASSMAWCTRHRLGQPARTSALAG